MARAARQPRSVASARSASHRAVWGPSPRKILDLLRSFLVQSWDETARFNNLLARLSILLVRRPPHLPHLLLRPCVSRPAMSGGEGGGEREEGNVAGLETNCGQYQMWFQEFATSDRQTAAFCSCSPSRDIAVQLVHSMNFQWRSGVGICWHKVLSMAGPPPPPPPPPPQLPPTLVLQIWSLQQMPTLRLSCPTLWMTGNSYPRLIHIAQGQYI